MSRATSFAHIGKDLPERFAAGLFLFILLGLASSQVASFDIFWQLQSGRYILETQSFLYQDTFSLASDAFRFEHCWLHDIIFYLVFSLGGYSLMSLFKGMLICATATLLILTARERNSSWLAILLVGPLLFMQTQTFWSDRPQLWSFLICAGFLYLLERYRCRGGRCLWLLLPLQVAWVNLHAGAVLAFPLASAYLLGSLLDQWSQTSSHRSGAWRGYAWLMLGLVVASVVNPYGIRPLEVLFAAPGLGEASGQATQVFNWDWRAIDLQRFPQYAYALAGAAACMVLGWRRFAFVDLLLLAGLGYMGLTLERHTPFWFFAAWALIPRYLDVGLNWSRPRHQAGWQTAWRIVGLGLFLCALYWVVKPTHDVRGWFKTGLLSWQYPVAASEFIQQHELSPNLFHDYTSGGYLMWRLYPDYRVFWDARQDSPVMFDQGLHVISGRPGWDRVLRQYQVQTIVLAALSPVSGQRYLLLDRLQADADWHLVFADRSFMVFVRSGSVAPDWLAEHRLAKERIDDTRLSAARLYSERLPLRPGAFWEMAQVWLKRKRYPEAFEAIEKYLTWTVNPDPVAIQYYEMLWPRFGQRTNDHQAR